MGDIPPEDLPPPPVKDDNPAGFRPIGNGMLRITNSDDLWRDYTGSFSYIKRQNLIGIQNFNDWDEMNTKWQAYATANCQDDKGMSVGAATLNAHLTDWEPTYSVDAYPPGICLQKCPSGYQKKWTERNFRPYGTAQPGYWQCTLEDNVADAIAEQILPHDPIEGNIVLQPFEIEKLPYSLQVLAVADPSFMNDSVAYMIDIKRALGDDFNIYMDFTQEMYSATPDIFLKASIAQATPYYVFSTFSLDNRVLNDVVRYFPRVPIKRGFPPYYQSFQFEGVPTDEEIQAAIDAQKRGVDLDAKFAYDTYNAYIDLVNAINNPEQHMREDQPFTTMDWFIVGVFGAIFILF